jgi:CheY-like chemotaxis protein
MPIAITWRGGLGFMSEDWRVEFDALFTQGVRHVVPLGHARGLRPQLDYFGPKVEIEADERRLRRALHRLFCAGVDGTQAGPVMFTAHASVDRGVVRVAVAVECSEAIGGAQRNALLERLGVSTSAGDCTQVGSCPVSGGALSFAHGASGGSTLRLELAFAGTTSPHPPAAAAGAPAFILDSGPTVDSALGPRLRRMGWAPERCEDIAAATQRLRAWPASSPGLVIAYESETVMLPRLLQLAARLPSGVQMVLAVEPGSPTRALEGEGGDVRICTWPFSEGELHEFTRRLRPAPTAPPGGLARPAPQARLARRRALVVDDNGVNQILAAAFLQHLGLEADTAADGLEAIHKCLDNPPDLVLMDLQMPRLDGIGATRRLRALQRDGHLPPFAIIAATASPAAQSASACLSAGMDGHLQKPLSIEAMRVELRRVGSV